MLPSRALIKQFRSIRELELAFDPTCQILLGVNETGKTSILRALSLLSPRISFSRDDVRQVGPHEPEPTESSIEFFFPVDDHASELSDSYAKRIFGGVEAPLARSPDGDLFANQLAARYVRELLFYIDVQNRRRLARYWQLPNEVEPVEGWMTATKTCPKDYQFSHPTSGVIVPHRYLAIRSSEIPKDQPENFFRALNRKDLVEGLGHACTSFLEANLPECIWWTHAADDGLPASVNLDEFLTSPGKWPALHNMFRLAEAHSPAETFKSARTRANGVRTLLERVADRGTAYIRSVWSEFSALRIELHENGPLLECVIRDVVGAFDFARRSDGFRRFVSFLLHVSSRMPAGTLSGAVLLYDEPDTSLHPSGARQLRDELLRLATSNVVVYSTHSIFMVDPTCVARHLIVRREKEITAATRALPSSVRNEEVLYNAIGHSIFAVLRSQNIILEGHRDKVLVDCVLASNKTLSARLEGVGFCHAGGVKNIAKLTPILQLAGKECVVISDSDGPAHQARKEYEGHAEWKTYAELVGERFVTAEDFLVLSHVQQAIDSLASASTPELGALKGTLAETRPVMVQVNEVLAKAGVSKDRRQEVLNCLKTELYCSLDSRQLRPDAETLVEAMATAVTSAG